MELTQTHIDTLAKIDDLGLGDSIVNRHILTELQEEGLINRLALTEKGRRILTALRP